jgi:WD40 repeat protein
MISIAEKVIRIYNLENKAERLINEEELMTSLSVSNDGRFLLVNLTNQEIHLWDITDNSKLLFKYRGHRQTRFVIRSSFGGSSQTFIVSGSEDSQVTKDDFFFLVIAPPHFLL